MYTTSHTDYQSKYTFALITLFYAFNPLSDIDALQPQFESCPLKCIYLTGRCCNFHKTLCLGVFWGHRYQSMVKITKFKVAHPIWQFENIQKSKKFVFILPPRAHFFEHSMPLKGLTILVHLFFGCNTSTSSLYSQVITEESDFYITE